MKRPGLILVAALSALASGAWAQDPSSARVTVSGEAEQMCVLGTLAHDGGPLVNFDSPSGAVFAVTRLTDDETLTTRAASLVLAVSGMCNGVHRVVIASDNNGLWREGVSTGADGFATAVPFEADVSWADQHYRLNADANTRGYVEQELLIGRPATGAMLIELRIAAGTTNLGLGAPLLAGEYSDVIRITVEPQ